ncbi:hypothetical protein LAD77_00070 [Klebsiella pneumoniae]|nr:hypothetical protein [Klebsiella pneumoniae]
MRETDTPIKDRDQRDTGSQKRRAAFSFTVLYFSRSAEAQVDTRSSFLIHASELPDAGRENQAARDAPPTIGVKVISEAKKYRDFRG